ncbi:MAG: polysaccharide biosynthesis C-terminal domain-containing protein [Flavobacteriales bacterium]
MGSIARQTTWNTALSVAGLGLGFLNMALLYPRYLSTDEFGVTRLVVSMSILTAQIAHLGMEPTVIRYFPYFRDGLRRHSGFFRLAILIASLGTFVAMAVLLLLNDRFVAWFNDPSGLYRRYGLVVLPLVLAEVYYLVLRGFSRVVHRSIAPVFVREFLLRGLQTLLIIAHVVWHLPFGWFLGLFVSTFLLTTLVLFVDLWRAGELGMGKVPIRIPKRVTSGMSRYAAISLGVSLAGVAAGNMDQLLLAALLRNGVEYVAYYAVAQFIASVIGVPGRAMVIPLVPLLADAWRKRDLERIAVLHRRSTTVLMVMAVYVALCIAANIGPIYGFLKPEYRVGAHALLLLCVTNVISQSGGLGSSIIGTSRRYAFDTTSSVLYLGLNAVLDVVFIRWWGLDGVAWSSLCSVAVIVAWRAQFLWRTFRLWPYERRTVLLLLLATVLTAVAWAIPSLGNGIADMVVRCTVITGIFWGVIASAQVTPEVNAQAMKMLRRLTGR